MSNETKEQSLSEMVEKIITNGTMSQEDQLQLNQCARSTPRDDGDFSALERLQQMIIKGEISVS